MGVECEDKYFTGTMPINEKDLLNQIEYDVKSGFSRIKVNNAFPTMTFEGNFKEIVNAFASIVEPHRRNPEIKFKLNAILE